MSTKYNYTDEEIKQKKQKMYEAMDKSVEEQAKEAEKRSAITKLGLERKTTDDTTDEQLLEKIKQKLDQKYGQLAKKAESDTANKRFSLNEQIEAAEAEAKKKSASVEKNYDEAAKSVENDALKRGIARSSIANGGIAEIENNKAAALNAVNERKSEVQSALVKEINGLKDKLNELYAEYEKQRAVEEQTEFDAAKKQRDDANNAAIEYNNKVSETENKYADELYEKEGDQALRRLAQSFAVSRMNEVVNFYRSFADKNAALADFMADDKLKDYLGDYYSIAFRLIYNE